VNRCHKRTSGLRGAREDQQRQTPTIWLGATLSGLTSAHPQHVHFLEAGCCPANSVKALKAKSYDTEYIVYSKKLMVCEHAETITVFNNATNTYNRQEYTNIKNPIHVHNNITILSNKITTSNKIQLQLLSTKAVVGINQ